MGAYSPSAGLCVVRNAVAEYIAARDGVPSSPEHIYMGSGASDVIKAVLNMFVADVNGKPPGKCRMIARICCVEKNSTCT